MKQKKVWIISGGILAIIVLLVGISMMNLKSEDADTNVIVGFYYYSGSTGAAIEFDAERVGQEFHIGFKEYNGGDQIVEDYTISFENFQSLLNKTSEEDCGKQSYVYQCGENSGCSYSSFFVNYSGNSENNICYDVTYEISNFFKNFHKLYSEIDYSSLSLEEQSKIDFLALLEDIDSIKNGEEIIHAKTEIIDLESVIYQGDGYVIDVTYHDDKINYLIHCNNYQIWYFEKDRV